MNEETWCLARELEKAANKEKDLFDKFTRARRALCSRWAGVWEHKQRMIDYRRAHRKWLAVHALWADLWAKYYQDMDNVEKEEDYT